MYDKSVPTTRGTVYVEYSTATIGPSPEWPTGLIGYREVIDDTPGPLPSPVGDRLRLTATPHGIDTAGDGRFDALAAEVTVDGPAGEYRLSGGVFRGDDYVTGRATADSRLETTVPVSLTGDGPAVVTLQFSGSDINDSGADGPFTVVAGLSDAAGTLLDAQSVDSPALSHFQFGEAPADIAGGTVVYRDDNADGVFDALVVSAAVAAYRPGDYTVAAVVSTADGRRIDAAGVTQSLTGRPMVAVTFPGDVLRALQPNGPYQVEVQLTGPGGEFLGSVVGTAEEFTPPPPLPAAGGLVVDTRRQVFRLDPAGGPPVLLGTLPSFPDDIAVGPDGSVYALGREAAVAGVSVLYRLAASAGGVTAARVGPLGAFVNALDFRADGALIGAGVGTLYRIDPATGRTTPAGMLVGTADVSGFAAGRLPDPPPPASPPPPPPGPAGPGLVVGGVGGGAAVAYRLGAAGVPDAAGTLLAPFPGFGGDVRAARGDFDGDGVTDTVLVTGPGTRTVMAAVSGVDGSVLLPATDPFGDANFTFGGFVTAGDIDKDGRAEWVVTPDLRGGPRVIIFHLLADGTFDLTSPGQPSLVANFFGIGDPSFRDGDRAALGDVNGDGVLDVFSIAAFNGGPRTALYDGADVLTARAGGRDPAKLIGDFFAAPSGADEGRGGRSIAAGDMDGDGRADYVVTGDNLLGTGNQVAVFSGADLAAGRVPGFGATPLADFAVTGQNPAAVAAVDADGDARADLAVGSGAGRPSQVEVYLGKSLSGESEPSSSAFDPFGTVTPGGVFVG